MDKSKEYGEWYSPTPIISWLRKISIYQTKNEYLMIGSNNRQTRFRILRVDRKEQTELKITDDKKEYTFNEISEILKKISNNNAKIKKISAFGIVGFIRFLEGYYMILISRRRKVAKIGAHMIYKIMETTMFYIPNINKNDQDEIKYLKMFQNVDLSSNFYFSYSYDISHTLQYNLTPFHNYDKNLLDKNILEKFNLSNKCGCVCEKNNSLDSEKSLDSTEQDTNDETKKNEFCFKCNINKEFAIRTKPNFKFVWNEYLLESANMHPDWLIYIIHGYVGQTIIKEFGKELYLTLIARRSKKFAGTRFLKRGTNQDGDVANEVESEQIISEIEKVHIRGSIPSHWSQDISKMVPKPQISIDIVDPFSVSAGKHFNQLLARYGSPVIVLNLVKMKEKRPHETLLTNEITRTIDYLNQFIPPAFHIQYIGMDMARINKSKDKNVLQNLSFLAFTFLKKVGIFQSFETESYSSFSLSKCNDLGGFKRSDGRILQTGVVRVNCVDCLDRTNTAAYALGKSALAFQLFGFGLIDDPKNAESNLIFEKKVCKKLEELYEEHGDVLALQYGGSQLVHRIKTYRKKSHLSSQSRDFMQTISRYCSNTFSDFDKQMAINLFIGAFRAYNTLNYNSFLNNATICSTTANSNGSTVLAYNHIWEMSTDFYLHNVNSLKKHVFNPSRLYTKWWDEKVLFCLPRACNEIFKGVNGNLQNLERKQKRNFLNSSLICNQTNISNGSNMSDSMIASSSDLNSTMTINDPNKLNLVQNKKSNRKDSSIRYNSSKLNNESTDEYNEHYNCYEYTSFDSMHFFELSRHLRVSERAQYSSSTSDFNPISLLLNNVKNSFLSPSNRIPVLEDKKLGRSTQSISSESDEEEENLNYDEKIQILNNNSNDFLFSLSLDAEKARFNNYLESKRSIDLETSTPINQLPPMRNSTSDNTNLKSLAIKHHLNNDLNSLSRRSSFNELRPKKSLQRKNNRNVYGQIYTYPNKLDQKLYSEYVMFGNLCGEFNKKELNKELNQSESNLNLDKDNELKMVAIKKQNKKFFKNYTSENDLLSSQKVNFKITVTNSNQLSDLLNYNSLEFTKNKEIQGYLEQFSSNEVNKEDKRLLTNYLDDTLKIKVSSKSAEDYKCYIGLVV